ncbi:polysaccharide deacetylase family protein [Paenibacillus profundus]|uniref:Polysaccharide deacetylase family protein n=1 Tax=Paenibacillus profundus TaxID=1173085 RepID=A0ABS8YA94_9BACL|nr:MULTISPECIES: polysaccharide deacetylase family protein [Paenibacillus]MCE5168838.1 polysaccharide deacetylase family protein [Paenibacillus profundus]
MNTRIMLLVLFAVLAAGCTPSGKSPAAKHSQEGYTIQQRQIKMAAKETPQLAGGQESQVREPKPLSLAELRKKYRSHFLLQGPSDRKCISLTFDDVPDNHFTPQVLDVLNQYGVKATFFVVGNRAEKYPEIVQRMVNEGHVIGNHSYDHANLPKLSDESFRHQVTRTEDIVRGITGQQMRYIRPPYGNISEEQIKWLASQDMLIVNWNVDSLDWKGLTPEQIEANVMSHLTSGAIVLQHAAGGEGGDLSGTVKALPLIIEQLNQQGIKMVTLPELLSKPAYRQ